MGLLDPAPPPFEVEEWRQRPHLERIKPLAQDWALNGFGTPPAVYLLYLLKLVVYAGGGLLVIAATSDTLGGLGSIGEWWTQPVVFQKAVAWTMLWEVLGLGAGSLPLTLRFKPMIGGVLYWLRPGTTRLPPWPERVPLTRGTTRTAFDVALYAGLLAALVFLLVSGAPGGRLDPVAVGVALALLVALGLRDKVPFLAARAEVYGNLMIVFLFPLGNLIVAAQLVFVCIWWGAAASKLNHHFPFVVTVMISNTPWNRSRRFKRRLYRDHPDDLLPSRLGALDAHIGTAIEFTLPLLLLVTSGGVVGTIAVAGMILFHLHILSTFPLAVPLEWNVFMIFGLLFLFGHYGDVPFSTLEDPLLLAILAVTCVAVPVLGNFRPDLVSFLPSMRYYAGNWATSQWLFRKGDGGGAEAKLDREVVKSAPIVTRQLEDFYDARPDRGARLQRARLPLDALARAGAERALGTGGRRRRGLRRARGGARRRRRPRLQLRRWPLPRPAAAGGGAGALPVRARRAADRDARVAAGQPAAPALPDLRRRHRAGRGRLGRGGGHDRAPALARRRAVPGRGRARRGGGRGERTAGMSSAVVVGAGPNGLACAATLAARGVEVTVIEAEERIGGGTRSAELTLPGLLHDECSGFHPMAVGSLAGLDLDLERHGLEWLWPEVDLAHPLDGGGGRGTARAPRCCARSMPPPPGWRRRASLHRLFGPSARG